MCVALLPYFGNHCLSPDPGPAVALRGDRVLCTVMFEKKRERKGKLQVAVMFTLNGRKIIISDEEEPEIYIDWDIDKPLYPYVSMYYGSSVVAKVRPQMWEWWVGVEFYPNAERLRRVCRPSLTYKLLNVAIFRRKLLQHVN